MFYLRGFLLCVFFHLVTSKGFPFSDVVSTPPVEIKPPLLDWGRKRPYYPSLAYLTVKNTDSGGGVLSIYSPYSSNSQFYPCNNFTGTSLGPGEIASVCFAFCPTNLGQSLAQLVLQTSFGGFLVRARGFALESRASYSVKPLGGLDSLRLGHARVDYNTPAPSLIKATDTRRADELVLNHGKSQATENLNSALDNSKVQSPVIQVFGTNPCPKSIPTKNPSQESIIASGILLIPMKVMAVILSAAALLFPLALLLIPIYRDFKIGKKRLDFPSGNQKQNDPLTEDPSRTQSLSANSDTRDSLDSRNLAKVGIKENKRRRRNKKRSCMNDNSGTSLPSSRTQSISPNERDKRSGSHNPNLSKVDFMDHEESIVRKIAGRAVLLPSETFPSVNSATEPYLALTSRIALHARAPGTKLRDVGDKMGNEEDFFTYDIWGDHLFGVLSGCRSNPSGRVGIENNWESFFVRDPQTLMMPNSFNKTCNK